MIAGNKSDLEEFKCVSEERARTYSKNVGCRHFLASAITGHNVHSIFEYLVEGIYLYESMKIKIIMEYLIYMEFRNV